MFQFGYFLIRNANCYPDRLALVCKEQALTYRELNMACNVLANHFTQLGMKKGDRIAYLFRNSAELVLIWYAAQKIGATAVPLNVHQLTDELARVIRSAQCRMLLYDGEFLEKAEKLEKVCPSLRLIVGRGETVPAGHLDWQSLFDSGDAGEAQVELSGGDEAVLLFTSGTTGASKGILRTQQMLRDHALMLAIENSNSDAPEIMLTPCPLFHTGGLLCLLKMASLGGTLVLMEKFEPQLVLAAIERYRVTQMLLIPPVLYQRLAHYEARRPYDLSSMREALCSGGKCGLDYALTIFELFPNCRLRPSWGSTEACSVTGTLLSREQIMAHAERAGTVGKLNAMTELRLVDDNNDDVEDGTVGEAIVRSSMVFQGYLNQPELTEQVLQDGWFYTADLMKRDADGYYYLVDRKNDMVKSGGMNVYAQEVEAVLQKHPAIMDCAVIGVPDERFGEAVAAAIVLLPGQGLTAAELLEYSKRHMPSYKKPRYWALLESLPVNSIGKLQKSVLRDHAKQWFKPIQAEGEMNAENQLGKQSTRGHAKTGK